MTKLNAKAVLVGTNLRLNFDYDYQLVQAVRKINDRKFDPKTRSWIVPFIEYRQVLLEFPGIEIDAETTELIKITEQARKEAWQKREQFFVGRFDDYTLPADLFEHQREGIHWLLEARRSILADEMGLGKTRQALLAAKAFRLPILVLSPVSVFSVWQRESTAVNVNVQLHSWAKVPPPPSSEFVLIADEAHCAQNIKSQRTRKFLTLARHKDCYGLYLLTGTPMKNGRPSNLYPLLRAIDHPIAGSQHDFEQRYCDAHPTKFTEWDISGASNIDDLYHKIESHLLRRTKAEALTLPPKIRTTRSIDATETDNKHYIDTLTKLQTEHGLRIEKGEIAGQAEAIVLLNQLRHASSVAKVNTAQELTEEVIEEGNQVVLFTEFLDTGRLLSSRFQCNLLCGDTPVSDRPRIIDRFQQGLDRSVICTFETGGLGITLTAAQTVILVDRPWTPGDVDQAEDRLHRIGQRNAVTSIWLQFGLLDEIIDGLLQSKQERIDIVVDGKYVAFNSDLSPANQAQKIFFAVMSDHSISRFLRSRE